MDNQAKPKIFIVAAGPDGDGDYYGFALAQDGTGLAQHLSSSRVWLRFDMGVTSSKKHKLYGGHYPGGYEIVDYIDATNDDLSNDPLYMEALTLNKITGETEGSVPSESTDH